MTFSFPFILLFVVLSSGIIVAIDKLIVKPQKPCVIAEYARSFFSILLLVFLVRSFIIQPYRVPSQSLEPTVKPGDFLAVNQFKYGLRLPVWDKKLLSIGEPKRGDIVIFHWPVIPDIMFVKRVIGLPGDRISYINKVLYINGKKAKQKFISSALDTNDGQIFWKVKVMQEDLGSVKHDIYVCAEDSINCPNHGLESENFYNLIVPKGQYLMMGDNRDDSEDSRVWGFVPEANLVGKAMLVWMSWDSKRHSIRWSRIGRKL